MTQRQRKFLTMTIGVVISVGIMYALFRKIDFVKLVDALESANYWWLVPNILLIAGTMFIRAYRWDFMIQPIKSARYGHLLAATCIGFMANNVLPLRLGEFVRAYSLAYQDRELTKSASLATIFVERMVFDLVALLIIFGGVLAVASVAIDEQMRQGLYIAIAVALAGLAFVFFLALKPNSAGELLTRYLFFLPDRIRETMRSVVLKFSRGLEFVVNARTAFHVGWLTVLIWLIMGVSNYFVFLAFGFDLPIDASFFLLVVVSISILVPSSPGFIGVYHAGTVFTLVQYGIGREDALSFALVLHAAQYIPITLMGFYYLRKAHLSLRQLEEGAVDGQD
ncbi:flippase-like domain-containing protein [candidate division GN15 bacterium]|nr:flippase-like domain-containing protein [candidate division GN15 bacterium]